MDSLPEKKWFDFVARLAQGRKCTWQGLFASVSKRNDTECVFLSIRIAKEVVCDRTRGLSDASGNQPYLLAPVAFSDFDTAVEAANAIMSALRPEGFSGCPYCGQETL